MKMRTGSALIPRVASLTSSQGDGILNFVPGLVATQDEDKTPCFAANCGHLTELRFTR